MGGEDARPAGQVRGPRHRKRITKKESRELWEKALLALINYHLVHYPEFREEARLAGFDGINLKTWFTAEVRDPKTKEVVNADQVTKGFEGGAALSKTLPRSKVGHGMLLAVLGSITRLALTLPETQPMPGDEPGAGQRLVKQLQETVQPHVDEWGDKPGVLLADGNFFTKDILRESYRSGYLPVIHPVAHPRGGLKALGLNRDGTPISSKPDADFEKQLIEAELNPADAKQAKRNIERKLDATRRNYVKHVQKMSWEMRGHQGWRVNGLREVCCKHGNQARESRYGRHVDGSAWSAVEGNCKRGCGRIYITAGGWRVSGGIAYPVLKHSPAEVAEADFSIGDPLDYNDPRSAKYGKARFAHGEGFLNNTKRRFFKDQNRTKTLDGIQLAAVSAFSIQHCIAMHYRDCLAAEREGLPIPKPGPVPDSVHWREQQEAQAHDPPIALAA